VHVEAAGDEAIDDVLNLGFGRPFLHDDDHECSLFPFWGSSAANGAKIFAVLRPWL
jgi:hypothetical protein